MAGVKLKKLVLKVAFVTISTFVGSEDSDVPPEVNVAGRNTIVTKAIVIMAPLSDFVALLVAIIALLSRCAIVLYA